MLHTNIRLSFQTFFLLAALVFSASAQEKLFDWSGTPDLFPGIKHVFINTDKPRPLKVNVIRVLKILTG